MKKDKPVSKFKAFTITYAMVALVATAIAIVALTPVLTRKLAAGAGSVGLSGLTIKSPKGWYEAYNALDNGAHYCIKCKEADEGNANSTCKAMKANTDKDLEKKRHDHPECFKWPDFPKYDGVIEGDKIGDPSYNLYAEPGSKFVAFERYCKANGKDEDCGYPREQKFDKDKLTEEKGPHRCSDNSDGKCHFVPVIGASKYDVIATGGGGAGGSAAYSGYDVDFNGNLKQKTNTDFQKEFGYSYEQYKKDHYGLTLSNADNVRDFGNGYEKPGSYNPGDNVEKAKQIYAYGQNMQVISFADRKAQARANFYTVGNTMDNFHAYPTEAVDLNKDETDQAASSFNGDIDGDGFLSLASRTQIENILESRNLGKNKTDEGQACAGGKNKDGFPGLCRGKKYKGRYYLFTKKLGTSSSKIAKVYPEYTLMPEWLKVDGLEPPYPCDRYIDPACYDCKIDKNELAKCDPKSYDRLKCECTKTTTETTTILDKYKYAVSVACSGDAGSGESVVYQNTSEKCGWMLPKTCPVTGTPSKPEHPQCGTSKGCGDPTECECTTNSDNQKTCKTKNTQIYYKEAKCEFGEEHWTYASGSCKNIGPKNICGHWIPLTDCPLIECATEPAMSGAGSFRAILQAGHAQLDGGKMPGEAGVKTYQLSDGSLVSAVGCGSVNETWRTSPFTLSAEGGRGASGTCGYIKQELSRSDIVTSISTQCKAFDLPDLGTTSSTQGQDRGQAGNSKGCIIKNDGAHCVLAIGAVGGTGASIPDTCRQSGRGQNGDPGKNGSVSCFKTDNISITARCNSYGYKYNNSVAAGKVQKGDMPDINANNGGYEYNCSTVGDYASGVCSMCKRCSKSSSKCNDKTKEAACAECEKASASTNCVDCSKSENKDNPACKTCMYDISGTTDPICDNEYSTGALESDTKVVVEKISGAAGMYNYHYIWYMPYVTKHLMFGEAGKNGAVVTKGELGLSRGNENDDPADRDHLDIVPGLGGGKTNYTSGKDGLNGMETIVTVQKDKTNVTNKIVAKGGDGGKGSLKTDEYLLCHISDKQNIDSNKPCYYSNEKNAVNVKSTHEYNSMTLEFEGLTSVLPESSLMAKLTAMSDGLRRANPGAGALGYGTESVNDYTCENRGVYKVDYINGAEACNENIDTKPTGTPKEDTDFRRPKSDEINANECGGSRNIKYILPNGAGYSAGTGAVIVVW